MTKELMPCISTGDYSYMFEHAESTGDTKAANIITTAIELGHNIDQYITNSKKAYSSSISFKSALAAMFNPASNFSNHPMHDQYFKILESSIDNLSSQLDDYSNKDSDLCSHVSLFLVTKLLRFPDTSVPSLKLIFDADDSYCRPLLRFIDSEQLVIILKDYLSVRKKSTLLPKQHELVTYIEKLIDN